MWLVQVNIGTEKDPKWKSIRPSGGTPYTFTTKEEAQSMLKKFYPDKKWDKKTRVVEAVAG